MPLQTDNLAMVGLGVLGDQPPHPIQPALPDGIHLRWAFDPERGFPWHGYHLFRRPSREGRPICISSQFDSKWRAGPLPAATAALQAGELQSDVPLELTDGFGVAGSLEFDLRRRKYLRFALGPGRPAREFRVSIGLFGKVETEPPLEDRHGCLGALAAVFRMSMGMFGKVETEPPLEDRHGCLGAPAALFRPREKRPARPLPIIKVTALDAGVPVASAEVSGPAGTIAAASLSADRIDRIEIDGGDGALVDLCFVPVDDGLGAGWGPLPGFPYPLCLPTAAQGYPCPGAPATAAQAEATALGRVRYGPAGAWAGAPVGDLLGVLDDLAAGGPAGQEMADRTATYPDSLLDPQAPVMRDQRPLDLVLIGAINPAIAQMVGLYWIDDPEPDAGPAPAAAYDYLLLADYDGSLRGDPDAALAALAQPLPDDIDGWICFGLAKRADPPLPAPEDVEVFALPGTAIDPALIALDQVNAAGLRWRIEQTADGDLLPGAAIGYHLWRAGLGAAAPTAPAAPSAYAHVTTGGMLIVAPSTSGPNAQRPSDWPSFPLHKIDARLTEGWYAYLVRGMDIFGRISGASAPAAWRQWTPEPEPRPWYYLAAAGAAQIHPSAVRLLVKTPPPPVPGVEAWTLDPLDPALDGETVYDAWKALGWWGALPAADRPKRAGLRVRWRWGPEQMAQAPRTKEFRLYFSPGTDPVAGHEDPLAWPERIQAIDAASHFTPVIDTASNLPTGELQYEVLLPEDAAGQTFAGVPLEPTDADPIVYAHVAVTAADDRLHSADHPKWAAGGWGGRAGNEGRIGAASKIARVLRAVPPAPAAIGFDDKVWATRADYHGLSYFTVRWVRPAPGQKVHIFRTVDDNLFRTDWERRGKAGAAAFQAADAQPFGWNAADQAAVLAELGTPLDAVAGLGFDADPAVRAAYEALSERALRVLASHQDNDDAFVQTTFEPLDPADPANADRAGPDALLPYTPNPAWGAWTAPIDGKAANRYFFRAAYVNSAHSVGPLGPSSPAVYLPKVAPPRVPAITKVTSGELAITLEWAHNREPDFAEYRLYRADDERQARDARLMARVLTLARADVDMTKPGVEWTDTGGLIGGRTYLYCLTSVDDEGNESAPSAVVSAIAVDTRIPEPPDWIEATWVLRNDLDGSQIAWQDGGSAGFTPGLRLGWASEAIDPVFGVTRRAVGDSLWTDVPGEIERQGSGQAYTLVVPDAEPLQEVEYQVRVRALTGSWSRPNVAIRADPPQVPA